MEKDIHKQIKHYSVMSHVSKYMFIGWGAIVSNEGRGWKAINLPGLSTVVMVRCRPLHHRFGHHVAAAPGHVTAAAHGHVTVAPVHVHSTIADRQRFGFRLGRRWFSFGRGGGLVEPKLGGSALHPVVPENGKIYWGSGSTRIRFIWEDPDPLHETDPSSKKSRENSHKNQLKLHEYIFFRTSLFDLILYLE